MIVNLSDVRRAHQKLISATSAGIILELADAGKFAVDYVKTNPTFTPRSGHLQSKTTWVPYKGKAIRIQNTAKYALPIEEGSRPHVIRPRKAKALRFVVKGKVVFARKVNHPGNRPYRFLRAAAVAAGSRLYHGLETRMDRAAIAFSSSR